MNIERIGRLACLAALSMLGASIVLTVLGHLQDDEGHLGSPLTSGAELCASAAFVVVGTVLVLHRPRNVVGWILLLASTGFLSDYAAYTVLVNPDSGLPGGTVAAAVNIASWMPAVFGVSLLLLSFPSGRIASPAWRRVIWVEGAAMIAGALWWALTNRSLDPPYDESENPILIEALSAYSELSFIVVLGLMLTVPFAALNLFNRFRHSRGKERRQFRWLAFSGCLVIGYFAVYAALGNVAGELAYALFNLVLVTIPMAIGIAVLRYRLYDIDRIINRTLTYGLLTLGLAATYFGVVVALQALLRPLSGGNDLAIVVTTLVVAALFLPARRRLQVLVDRRFNRRAYDAARTVDAFSARLREQIDLDTLRYELLGVVNETMQPATTSLWVRRMTER